MGAILREHGRILLGRRSPHRRTFPDRWDVIGGHVEPGEAPADALVRELREEIGVVVASAILVGRLDLGPVDGRRMMLHLFAVDRWEGAPGLVNDEHSELCWFDLPEATRLPLLAVAGYRIVFADLARQPSPRIRSGVTKVLGKA